MVEVKWNAKGTCVAVLANEEESSQGETQMWSVWNWNFFFSFTKAVSETLENFIVKLR